MTAPWQFRSLAAALFTACVGLATVSGCSGPAPKPENKDEKKDEAKSDPKPVPVPGTNPAPGTNPTPAAPPKTALRDIDPQATATVGAFLGALIQGTASPDALSKTFLQVIGKPLLFPGDKEKGYSVTEAASWLKRTGESVNNFTPSHDQHQVGDVVFIRAALTTRSKKKSEPGGYSLRLVKEGSGWKVDWFSLTSVDPDKIAFPPATTPDAIAQGFVLAAFIGSVTADPTVFPATDRASLISAALTEDLRKKWAEPFASDVAEGRDYNPGKINTEAVKVGGGTTAITVTRAGEQPEFKVELTKPTGKTSYVVKLVKGAGPAEWRVSEVTETKG